MDNCRINLDYKLKISTYEAEKEVLFIYFVLGCFFEHQDLIEEYFFNVLNEYINEYEKPLA